MTDAYVIRSADGSIQVPGATLESLVARAAERVPGARVRRRSIDVTVHGERARVALELSVRRGAVVPELGAGVQREVAHALEASCGLATETVDVHVEALS